MPDDLVDLTLAQAANTPPKQRKPGPGGVLITWFEKISWTYRASGVFQDSEGSCIHILHTPHQELRQRTARAWQQWVGHQFEQRKGFDQFRHVRPSLSSPCTTLTPDEKGFIRIAQNGSFYTADMLQISGHVSDSKCKFCEQDDSVHHRHWDCSATAFSRALMPPDILKAVLHGPQCLREHGGAVEDQSLRDYKHSLSLIPDSLSCYTHTRTHIPFCQTHIDIFCDGTSRDPSKPPIRLAAWSTVLAGATPQDAHRPLSWGGLPGQWQTVARAELFAFLSALQYGHCHHEGTSFSIWSDSEYVIKRAARIQHGFFPVHPAIADHDCAPPHPITPRLLRC